MVDIVKAGGPAFPVTEEQGDPRWGSGDGMTLRDYFAGQALANPAICRRDDEYPQRTAYAFADAMLKARQE